MNNSNNNDNNNNNNNNSLCILCLVKLTSSLLVKNFNATSSLSSQRNTLERLSLTRRRRQQLPSKRPLQYGSTVCRNIVIWGYQDHNWAENPSRTSANDRQQLLKLRGQRVNLPRDRELCYQSSLTHTSCRMPTCRVECLVFVPGCALKCGYRAMNSSFADQH